MSIGCDIIFKLICPLSDCFYICTWLISWIVSMTRSYVWLSLIYFSCVRLSLLVMLSVGLITLLSLFDTINVYFSQFSSLFRCWDWASADGNLHISSGGDDQRRSRNVVLHEPQRARSSPLTFGSFKSISGNFNLFSDLMYFKICVRGFLFWNVGV